MQQIITLGQNDALKGLNDLAYSVMGRALQGKADSYIFKIQDYLTHEPTSRQYYSAVGASLLGQMQVNSPKVLKDGMLDKVSQEYQALLGLLSEEVVIGVDLKDGEYSASLYTSSIRIIENLVKAGMASVEDAEKAFKALTGDKIAKAVTTETHYAVRLDFDAFVGKVPVFKLVSPRSNLALIGSEATHLIFPVNFIRIFEIFVKDRLHKGLFAFSKDTVHGEKIHKVTTNPQVVKEIYATSDESEVRSKINRVGVGYDYIRLRFDLYDLESSIHSLGVASFRPEMLNWIKPISHFEVSTTQHNIDFKLVKGIIETGVNNLKASNIDSLTFIPLDGYATLVDKKKAILDAVEGLTPAQMLSLVETHSDIFGNLEDKLATRQRVAPKFLKGFEPVKLSDDPAEAEKEMYSLMESGVVRFVARKKDGGLSRKVVSNVPTVLERIYGKGYVKEIESPKIRLQSVLTELGAGGVTSREELEKLLVSANVVNYLNMDEALKGGQSTVTSLVSALHVLAEKEKNRKKVVGQVTYRSLDAETPERFYGSVNVTNILQIEYRDLNVK